MIALRLPKDTCFACPHRARNYEQRLHCTHDNRSGNDGWHNISISLIDPARGTLNVITPVIDSSRRFPFKIKTVVYPLK